MTFDMSATRPLVLGTSAQIGAPFTAVKEAQGQTDANALTERFSQFAIQLWDRLVGFRDFLSLFLLLSSLHLALVTRMSDETNAGSDCAVNSWVIIFIMSATFALLVVSSIVRQLSAFNVTAETVLGLVYVAASAFKSNTVAIVLAAATGPFRWKASNDDCSATSNPHAYGTYLLADVLGTGSVFLILLSIYAKPFLTGNPLGSVVIAAILAVVIQYTLLELWLVPELAKVWQEIEVNGTSIDSTLNDLSDRISDVEGLFNVSLR